MWYETSVFLPNEGRTVEAMDSGGRTQMLIRKGVLWWFPDMSMYVYYVPQRWKYV